jgi:hypothetical protein
MQAANTGKKPGAGSVSVPLKEPADVIVPRSSISDPDVDVRKISDTPELSVIAPLTGRLVVDPGLCQKL